MSASCPASGPWSCRGRRRRGTEGGGSGSGEASVLCRGWGAVPGVAGSAAPPATTAGRENGGDAAADGRGRLRTRVPDLRDAPEETRRDLAAWHHELYPHGAWLATLEPDLLGEALVARVLTDSPGIGRAALTGLKPEQVIRVVTVLKAGGSLASKLRTGVGGRASVGPKGDGGRRALSSCRPGIRLDESWRMCSIGSRKEMRGWRPAWLMLLAPSRRVPTSLSGWYTSPTGCRSWGG